MQLSIVIPLFNEDESLPELSTWIEKVMLANQFTYEVLFIDDGSKDNSWKVITELASKNPNIKGIKFTRNYGKSAALFVGFEQAMGDVVITMDADLQDSPEEIPGLYNMIIKDNFDIVSELLAQVIKDSKLFNHPYKSVRCLIVNNLSTLVPNPLYQEDRKKTYLKFNTSLQGDELIGVDEIKSQDVKNVFALPSALKDKLDSFFNNISYHHFSSGLIDSLLAQNKNQTGKKLYVHIQSTHFETIVIEEKGLLFYNTFNHHSPEDFIYYLLFVCEQLQLNPEKIEVLLLGEVEKNSSIYSLAQKYIRNIKLGARSEDAYYSYQLQTFPKHFYFTLFNSYSA